MTRPCTLTLVALVACLQATLGLNLHVGSSALIRALDGALSHPASLEQLERRSLAAVKKSTAQPKPVTSRTPPLSIQAKNQLSAADNTYTRNKPEAQAYAQHAKAKVKALRASVQQAISTQSIKQSNASTSIKTPTEFFAAKTPTTVKKTATPSVKTASVQKKSPPPPPPRRSPPPPPKRSPPPPPKTEAEPELVPSSSKVITPAYTGSTSCCTGLNAPSNPTPTMPQAGSIQPYNINAGPWPVTYTDAQMDSQREEGSNMLSELEMAAYGGANQFTILPGVYRINSSIYLEGVSNFAIKASGAEIIVEDGVGHFRILSCVNISFSGPVTMDGAPFGGTQGVIQDTDGQSYVDIAIMAGYPAPTSGTRIKFFNQQGLMQPLYQTSVNSVSSLGGNVYRISVSQSVFDAYPDSVSTFIVPGNLMAIEGSGGVLYGGFELRNNTGVTLSDVYIHSYSLIWTQGELGPVTLNRVMGVRRPNTNRLGAGGYLAINLNGGSLLVNACAFSHNYDDLTDLSSNLGYASGQPSPKQVYYYAPLQPSVGMTLSFTGLTSFASHGTAKITAITASANNAANSNFVSALNNAGVTTQGATPWLVTLSTAVTISALDIVAVVNWIPSSITVQNSYFSDSLACGICAKGAAKITLSNNTVERSGNSGVNIDVSPYWWEGPTPANGVITNNVVNSSPYSLNVETGAIIIDVDEGNNLKDMQTLALANPIRNMTISGNTVTNARVSGIEVTFSGNANIRGNTIVNPGVRRYDTGAGFAVPTRANAAIQLWSVGSTVVSGNTIKGINTQAQPQAIRMIGGPQAKAYATLCNNVQTDINGNNTSVPLSLWNKSPINTGTGIIQGGSFVGGGWGTSAFWVTNGTNIYQQEPFQVSSTPNNMAVFTFTGTRARFYGTVGRMYGLAKITLDGKAAGQIDESVVLGLPGNVTGDPNVGVGDQLLYDTGALTNAAHNLTVLVLGMPGSQSASGATAVGISGFDYLAGPRVNAIRGCAS